MTEEISLEQWLISRDYTPQEAALWCDFISDSFDLIDDGHALLCSPNEWSSFLKGCHSDSPTEPEITSGLGDRMKKLQADAPMVVTVTDSRLAMKSLQWATKAMVSEKPKQILRSGGNLKPDILLRS